MRLARCNASSALPAPTAAARRRRPSSIACQLVLVLCSGVTGVAAHEVELCPAAPDAGRAVSLNGVTVGPPSSAEQETLALAQLTAGDRDDRQRAAVSLGLGGSLPAFRRLLAARDVDGLTIFARFYSNPEGHACVADEIEHALLQHLDDPALRPALLAFLGKNLYTRRKLFDRLVLIRFDDGRPDDFVAVVRALTATRIEGIEAEVLAQAESLLAHDTPVLKRVLPAVHRTYVTFFGERLYAPSVGYMERLLGVEGYGETLDYFTAEFSVTRSYVYRALDRFPPSLVGEMLTRQLDRVVRECPPRLVLYEVSAFGASAVRHAATNEQRRQVGASLAALLGHLPASMTNQPPTRPAIDFRLYTLLLDLLVDLGSPEAGATLIRELQLLAESSDSSAPAMIVHTLQALARIPASAHLDVPRFLDVAARLPIADRLLHVPAVLDVHPDPAAHGFYVEQLGWIVDHRETLRDTAGLDASKAARWTVDRLLAFDEPEQLAATRDGLDRAFAAGLLGEAQYVAASDAVNQLTGDRSPVYEQLMERRAAAREAEVERKRAAVRAESLRIVDDNTSPEGIRDNLRKLGEPGSGSREAASWLVVAGRDILPMAHERLADPASSAELRFRLMQVLGEIGDPSSAAPLIDALRRDVDNRSLVKAGFLALGLVPPSPVTFEFARELVTGDRPVAVRQAALVYLASVREPRAADIAAQYSADTVEPDLRVAALLLAARLGLGAVRSDIVDLLETTEDRGHGEVLVRALGELATPEELRALADRFPTHRDRPYFDEVLRLVEFRRAHGERRVELARRLIEAGHPWDRREAVRSLVEDGPAAVLFDYLQLHPAMGLPLERSVVYSPFGVPILAQIRRMGYAVEETDEGFRLIPPDSSGRPAGCS